MKLYERREPVKALMWTGANLNRIVNFVGSRNKYIKNPDGSLTFSLYNGGVILTVWLTDYIVKEEGNLFTMNEDEFIRTYKRKGSYEYV